MREPMPFKNSGNVPIVGEPASVISWVPTFLVLCKFCQPAQPVLVVGLAPSTSLCPGCGRGFQMLGVQQNVQMAQPPQFQINIVLPNGATPPVEATPSNDPRLS